LDAWKPSGTKLEIAIGFGFRQDCRKREKIAADSLKRRLTGDLAVVSAQRQVSQYQDYRDLPEEEDAFAVGDAVQTAIYKSMKWQGSHEKWNHVNARKV
jgi:hypothetical protein